MKRIVFLIIASLLMIGLVLPGCDGGGGGVALVTTTLTFDKGGVDDVIMIGITGEYTHPTGSMAFLGASLAASMINGAGGVKIKDSASGDHAYNITLKFVETGEATVDQTGAAGKTAMLANKDLVDIFAGGFRTEALDVYRDVVMKNDGTGKIFINCGAATEALCQSVVTDYPNYRFFFKGTPYNEYFLGQSVARTADAVAKQIRTDGGKAADYALNYTIVADNLAWAFEQVQVIETALAGKNLNAADALHPIYLVDATAGDSGAELTSVLGAIGAKNTTQILIPVLSSNAGIFYDNIRSVLVPNAMSVGINVLAQLKSPWGVALGNPPGPTQPACASEVIVDTWAEGISVTALTTPFLSSFMFMASGEYPLYTAATFDVLYALKGCIEATAVYDLGTGKATADADTMIQWLENAANSQTSTTGKTLYYPKWDGTTTSGGHPALTSAQAIAIYPSVTYNVADWEMPGHTTHDICYGPGLLTGLGAQWQWDGASQWKKVGVWPIDYGPSHDTELTDQYGNWNLAYNGTVPLVIPANVPAALP